MEHLQVDKVGQLVGKRFLHIATFTIYPCLAICYPSLDYVLTSASAQTYSQSQIKYDYILKDIL